MASTVGDENAKPQDVNLQELHMIGKVKSALSRPRGQKRARKADCAQQDDTTSSEPAPKHRRVGSWLGDAFSCVAQVARTKCGKVAASGYKCTREVAGKVINGPNGGWSTVRQAFKEKVTVRVGSGRSALVSKLKAMTSSLGSLPPRLADASVEVIPEPSAEMPAADRGVVGTSRVETVAEETDEAAVIETVQEAEMEAAQADTEQASEAGAQQSIQAAEEETSEVSAEETAEAATQELEETAEASAEETAEATTQDSAETLGEETAFAVVDEAAGAAEGKMTETAAEDTIEAAAEVTADEEDMAVEISEVHEVNQDVTDEAPESCVGEELTEDDYPEMSDEAVPDFNATESDNADPYQEEASTLQQIWFHDEELDVTDAPETPVEQPFIDAAVEEVLDVPRPCISDLNLPIENVQEHSENDEHFHSAPTWDSW